MTDWRRASGAAPQRVVGVVARTRRLEQCVERVDHHEDEWRAAAGTNAPLVFVKTRVDHVAPMARSRSGHSTPGCRLRLPESGDRLGDTGHVVLHWHLEEW